jgi:hypothetical protein
MALPVRMMITLGVLDCWSIEVLECWKKLNVMSLCQLEDHFYHESARILQ